MLTFVASADGAFQLGASGPAADVLSVLTKDGLSNEATWGAPMGADDAPLHPALQLDARSNLLATLIRTEYVRLHGAGYVDGGPERRVSSIGVKYYADAVVGLERQRSDHSRRVAPVVRGDRVRRPRHVEIVPEHDLRIDHVRELHQEAVAAVVDVERKARLARELGGIAQEGVRQGLVAELEEADEVGAAAGAAGASDAVHGRGMAPVCRVLRGADVAGPARVRPVHRSPSSATPRSVARMPWRNPVGGVQPRRRRSRSTDTGPCHISSGR